MARRTVQQAAVMALAVYLQGHMSEAFGANHVKVEDRFPEPDPRLFSEDDVTGIQRVITIICAGKADDQRVQEEPLEMIPVEGSEHMATYRWKVAARRQPIQLDVWTKFAVALDETLAELDIALKAGTAKTMNQQNGMPVRDGPLLRLDLATGHDNFADFTFDAPDVMNEGVGRLESECRATLRGHVDVDVVVAAQSPRLARIKLEVALSGADALFTYTPVDGSFELTGSQV